MVDAKNLAFFGAGSFIGASGAIFLVWRHFQKLSEEKIAKFVADFNENLAENDQKVAEETVKESSDLAEKEAISANSDGQNYVKFNANEVINYGSFYKNQEGSEIDPAEMLHPSEEDFDEGEMDISPEEYEKLVATGGIVNEENENDVAGFEMTKESNSGKRPKLISAESFDNDYPHFDKIELEYYTGDDVLVDISSEEEIHDPERIVGDALDKFGFRENDEERVIFVRNFNHGADYEVSKVFSSFYGENS